MIGRSVGIISSVSADDCIPGQPGDLFDGIQKMYDIPNKEARQLVLIEAAGSYSQVLQLAQSLHKVAQEVDGLADDLVEALGWMGRQQKN